MSDRVMTGAEARGTAGEAYDVERIRADFPILFREIYGKPLVYLDNGASAQKPRPVIDAISNTLMLDYANVHRGLHFLSNQATAAFEKARKTAASFINAHSESQIVFTRSSTEAINLVADSYGRMAIGPGDEIVLSIMEHHSNIVPWHFHRERNGAVLRWAPITDEGVLDIEAFERLLGPRTKLVAITHMSNVLGTVVPVKEICRIAHQRGIPVLVDGSQGAVHLKVDVEDLDCDFYVFTGHKVYGPTGIGVLYAKRHLLEAMPPYQGGGEMIEHVGTDRITYGVPPHRFEAGTPPIVEAIGLGAALNYMMQVGRDRIRAHEDELLRHAEQRLSQMNFVRIHGRAPGKGSILAFSVDGLHPHDVATIVDRSGVAIRAGHHCAQPLMDRLGVTATCRASFAMYNTIEEVDVLADSIRKAHDFFG
ncbi:MAG: cysteine desulfurase [Hyphomicrobiaceae bacterium]